VVRRYVSEDEDSARWEGFPFRDGDVIISTRSKHGTTWMQMIVLLLIHQRPTLPAPLAVLSPWLDHLVEPLDEVIGRLQAQDHRRVIKTHTPLDGVPIDDRATYIVVARNPLDAAVSMYHHVDNIDRVRLSELLGEDVTRSDAPPPVSEWLANWTVQELDVMDPRESLDKLMWHLRDAWERRGDPNVLLVHYSDLKADLAGQVRLLADRLRIDVADDLWDDLVAAATFDSMRSRADDLAPDALGILADRRAFFRRGGGGAGAELLGQETLDRYHERLATMGPADLVTWLDR
jgi:aryl sulfotransferase